jgi:hypothetical protein
VCRKYLDTLGDVSEIPWLKDFKDKETFLTKPCNVFRDVIDTISRMVKVVNSYWRPAQLETNIDINSFYNALFVGGPSCAGANVSRTSLIISVSISGENCPKPGLS